MNIDSKNRPPTPPTRRTLLRLAAAGGTLALLPGCDRHKSEGAGSGAPASSGSAAPSAASARAGPPTITRALVKFPEKTELYMLTDRPPQLETPMKYFANEITPNEAFFVRWHLAGLQTTIDLDTFRLKLTGHVEQPLSLSMAELVKDFEPVSVVAVNQCSGNSRSYFEPQVAGGEWGNGAVGNAKWTGVRLKDLFAKAGVKAGAVDVSLQGLDRPVLPTTPEFVKSLSYEHANDGEVIVAYAMNDAPMPILNGHPLRLIVPGWFATYWVKSLTDIKVLPEKFKGFWMDTAYRVPDNPRSNEAPNNLAKKTVPISKMCVRSLFARPQAGEQVKAGQAYEVRGMAFDEGHGIKKVDVSSDGGKTWAAAALGRDLGKYSFHKWTYRWNPSGAGPARLMARATNNAGDTQPAKPKWNRSGYARNVIEAIDVTVV
ncbi:MAG TPA: molybdopterin-dependent oxidoreductase [Tepidisphaeraceae bacterium]|nr:molybdopterin-dependent oxidoreductase [Tepidisphaeraceae bacterium]